MAEGEARSFENNQKIKHRQPPRVIALVGAREHILKRREFLDYTSWLVHFRELHPRKKRSYLAKFPKRFSKISNHLLYVRIFRYENELQNFVNQLEPAVLLVDDKLLNLFQETNTPIVPEKNIRYKHHERLMLLADNLANYFRIILKEKPRNYGRELRKFEK
ncbi:MAG: hypothetical protein DRH17_13110 [Deltaproteobacteria bacterium]|nr:MAG: hypothetical protein DRH17_13110 [Deltaproteobacteria bacterium]